MSPSVWFIKSRQKRWEKHVACIGKEKLMKSLLESLKKTHWNRLEDNIKMHFKEIVWVGMGGFSSE
jgi:hypothetical protein